MQPPMNADKIKSHWLSPSFASLRWMLFFGFGYAGLG